MQKLPLIAEPDFIRGLIRELPPSGTSWKCSGLQALAYLAWGLALATLHMAPSNLHPPEGERYNKYIVANGFMYGLFNLNGFCLPW